MSLNLKLDLKELARLKIKLDLITELYNTKRDETRKKIEDAKTTKAEDPDGVLKLNIIPSEKREFSVEKTKTILGEHADTCIREIVDSKAFSAVIKNLKIPEEKYKQCYSTKTSHSVTWDGIDVYKSELEKKINA